MIQTINAIQQFSAEEFSSGTGIKFMITYRLNQDVIENLFGIYRIKGGCNKNPTAKSLRSMFRSSLLNNLIKFDQSNCESDHDIFVTQESTQSTSPKPSTSSCVIQQSITDDDGDDDIGHIPTEPSSNVPVTLEEFTHTSEDTLTLETCSVVYFAGWLGKSCIENSIVQNVRKC